jgi:inorganic pyrophosphatase
MAMGLSRVVRHAVGMHDPTKLPMHHDGLVVVVVETPSGSGNKLKYDEELGVYRLDRVLPAGMTFPFEFGFIPETVAEDGDPLDVIVLLDSPVQAGCIVEAKLIGVIEGEQQDRGSRTWDRNDRLVAVAGGPKGHAALRSLDDVDPFRLQAIESFFTNYHALDGEKFRVLGRRGIRAAEAAIRKAHGAFVDQAARRGTGTGTGAGKATAASA